jgi:hypothetical protein
MAVTVTKPKPDPVRVMSIIQAERALDSNEPTTLHRVLGESGHVRMLARQLLANERSFRAAVAAWYKSLGKAILAGIRAADGNWLQAARYAVTDAQREKLTRIVQQHVERSALLSAAISWMMHQTQRSTKAVLAYVHKGLWSFVKNLPEKVVTAVKAVVIGVMLVFQPEAVIEPIIARVETAIVKTVETLPNEKRAAAIIASGVQQAVFTQERIAATAAGVAVTSNTSAANAGTAAAGQVLAEAGVVNVKRWATLHGSGDVDDRVRPSHRKANGQTVGVRESFTVDKGGGTETCDYPGDPKLSAQNARNCRCLAIYLKVEK